MKRAVFYTLLALTLAACTPPLEDGAFQNTPRVEADKLTARVGEPVEVTLTGGFEVAEKYYLEETVVPGLLLGACLAYVPDETVRGGLCNNDDEPLPDSLSMVSGTTYVKDFGNFVVKRGESRQIQHTFTFTSSQPGEIVIAPAYQIHDDAYESPGFESGTATRVTFE